MALKHYNLYLDDEDPADQTMIALLQTQVKKRRVGEFLRRALETYIRVGHQLTPAPMSAPVLAYAPTPPPPQPPLTRPSGPMPPPASNNPAVAKLRNAFMRG